MTLLLTLIWAAMICVAFDQSRRHDRRMSWLEKLRNPFTSVEKEIGDKPGETGTTLEGTR